jgi:tetratricopeptide (TPR) repeat protein
MMVLFLGEDGLPVKRGEQTRIRTYGFLRTDLGLTMPLICFTNVVTWLAEMNISLEPADTFHIQAAQGWLELGSVAEAKVELGKIVLELQRHPEVLKVQWGIFAAEMKWEAALEVAAALIELEPEDQMGWVHRSYSLHEVKRTKEARDNLLRVVGKFPFSATMRYNLACYECQLGDLAQAKKWLEKAFRIGNREQMKLAALEDPDLKPLWDELKRS